jgi:hypothetical protein
MTASHQTPIPDQTADGQSLAGVSCSDSRFANQGQLFANICENVESGKYGFAAGKHQFAEWKKRAMQSASNGERQALLIEADRLMQETKARTAKQDEPKARKWKFW